MLQRGHNGDCGGTDCRGIVNSYYLLIRELFFEESLKKGGRGVCRVLGRRGSEAAGKLNVDNKDLRWKD